MNDGFKQTKGNYNLEVKVGRTKELKQLLGVEQTSNVRMKLS